MMTDQLVGNGLRWGQRISVNIPVQVAAQASPAIRGHLKSISLSGALMEADHELRLHAYIEVSYQAPGNGAQRYEGYGACYAQMQRRRWRRMVRVRSEH
jgi:hypothetical protein